MGDRCVSHESARAHADRHPCRAIGQIAPHAAPQVPMDSGSLSKCAQPGRHSCSEIGQIAPHTVLQLPIDSGSPLRVRATRPALLAERFTQSLPMLRCKCRLTQACLYEPSNSDNRTQEQDKTLSPSIRSVPCVVNLKPIHSQSRATLNGAGAFMNTRRPPSIRGAHCRVDLERTSLHA